MRQRIGKVADGTRPGGQGLYGHRSGRGHRMPKNPSIAVPCRLLIVEDEWLVAAGIADQLDELNLEVAGIAVTEPEALRLLATTDVDAVLLDMKMHEKFVGEVADALQRQGVPFLFVSGYTRAPDPRYDEVPILVKPFDVTELHAALASILPPQCFPKPDNLPVSEVA
jgi:CheY-like chemotaxis protein